MSSIAIHVHVQNKWKVLKKSKDKPDNGFPPPYTACDCMQVCIEIEFMAKVKYCSLFLNHCVGFFPQCIHCECSVHVHAVDFLGRLCVVCTGGRGRAVTSLCELTLTFVDMVKAWSCEFSVKGTNCLYFAHDTSCTTFNQRVIWFRIFDLLL